MYLTVFKGFVEQDKRETAVTPYFIAVGNMKRTQYQHNGALTYASQTDTAIATALLTAAGVPQFDVQGAGTSLATVKALALRDGQPAFTLLNTVDQTMGYITADNPGGAVRRTPYTIIPAAHGAWSYSTNIVSIKRRRSIRGVHNHVRVVGIQSYGATTEIAPADSAYEFRSEAVQGNTLAGTVATRILHEVNRQIDEVVVTIPGNPYLSSGMTITITNADVGLDSATPYLIRHVVHDYDATGLVDTVYLEGGPASDGYAATVAPHAEFTFTVLKTTDSGSVVHYAISCDASASWDADSAPDSLTYAWTDNKSTSGTGKYFTLNLIVADLSPIPTITLTVTDTDALTDAVTQAIDIAGGGVDIALRALYVAASSQAEATADGTTWHTWAPGSGTVISTAQNSPNYGLFGLSDGKLYHTADYLATSPTLVHTFWAAVNAMWINENTPNRVTVGLADGALYQCTDVSLLGSSSWSLIQTYSAAVKWVVENADASQIWVCSGIYVYVNHVVQATAFDTTNALAMSYFGNYACINYTGAGGAGVQDPTSYGNLLGGGTYPSFAASRVGAITISTTAPWYHYIGYPSSVLDELINGGLSGAICFGSGAGVDMTGYYLRFDFGAPYNIDEATFHFVWGAWDSGTGIITQWQGSNDGSSWANIGTTKTWAGGSTHQIDSSLAGNTTFYRYYQLVFLAGTKGSNTLSPSDGMYEVCFKLVKYSITSYWNPLGGGEYATWQSTRVGQITVGGGGVNWRQSPFSGAADFATTFIDGTTGNFIDIIGTGAGGDITGAYIRFDFGTPQCITEHRGWHQNGANSYLNGYFKWQACNDNASWVDIGSGTFKPQAMSYTDTTLAGNTGFYRYYRMLGVSGTWTAGPFNGTMHCEETFKISGAAPAVVIMSADDGSTKLSASSSVKAISHHIRNGVCWAMDDGGHFYELADGGTSFTDLGDSSCGLAYAMHRDGDNQDTIYLGAASGFWVSFNRGRLWTKLRDYSGAGLDGLAIGYGARSLA